MCKDTIIVVRESVFQNWFCRSVLADYVKGWFVLEPTLLEPNLYTRFYSRGSCEWLYIADTDIQVL